MKEKNAIYLEMMKDILDSKERILNSILEITKEQGAILKSGEVEERFEESLNAKDKLIKETDRLDRGFSDAYAKISADIRENSSEYKEKVLKLQERIRALTDTGVKIQALEEQNRIAFEAYLNTEKKKIKDFKVSSKTVSSYYRNMTGKPQGDAYFMDKKK